MDREYYAMCNLISFMSLLKVSIKCNYSDAYKQYNAY